jgi:hypothetical protein
VDDVFRSNIVNVVGGSPANVVGPGVYGATISGGGAVDYFGPGTNRVEANFGTIGGGVQNAIQTGADFSTIGGGSLHMIQTNSHHSTIGGGRLNTIQSSAYYATISGGSLNAIQPDTFYATIPGGQENAATDYAFAAGRRAKANHVGAFVWADSQGASFASTASNQFNVRAAGGVRLETAGAGAILDGLPVLAGTVPSGALSGAYSSAVAFTNAGNSFAGNGSGLTQLTASQLKSGIVDDARLPASVARTDQVWLLGGNAGTTPGVHFVGTSDSQPLEIKVNGLRGLRLEDNGDGSDFGTAPDGAPNIIGGSPANVVAAGVVGATIGGGGATNYTAFGDPNIVRADYGTVGGGLDNRVDGFAATIAGGHDNIISSNSSFTVVGGGRQNSVSFSSYSVIGGGNQNSIQLGNEASVLAGGRENTIASNAFWSVLAGGYENLIGVFAHHSVIGGGVDNGTGANAVGSTVAGGAGNYILADAEWGAIGGGSGNIIINGASHATIPGGKENRATDFGFAAGRRAKANHPGAFVWADSTDSDFASTSTNQFNVRAGGGARFETGGAGLTVDGLSVFTGNNGASLTSLNASQLASGTVADTRLSSNVALKNQNNTFSANQSVPVGSAVGPGLSFSGDTDTGLFAPAANTLAVATGAAERMRMSANGVGIGETSPEGQLHVTGSPSTPQIKIETTSTDSFVKLRLESFGKPYWDFAVGGSANLMNWYFSGTAQNLMTLSTNGHLRVHQALGVGADSPDAHLTAAGNSSKPQLRLQQTTAGAAPRLRMINGVSPYWDLFTESGGRYMRWYAERTGFDAMTLEDDGTLITTGPVNPPSDRNVKQDFAAVDALAVLEQVAALPIQSWAYKNSPDTRHIGPVAQDFHAAFQFNGDDDKHIATVDADGVALAAIQGLNQKTEDRSQKSEARIQKLEAENGELKARLGKLEQLLNNKLNGGAL